MRLVLINFFCFFLFFFKPVLGEKIEKKYTVKTSGIKIGMLVWTVNIDDLNYLNKIVLKSEGLFSRIYKFEGKYFSEGKIEMGQLKPTKYNHFWKTKKTTKKMNLVFKDEKLITLNQTPVEKERLRTNVFDIQKNKDPLSSFLQIVRGEKNSFVIDGRRTYKMSVFYDNETKKNTVMVLDYFNLWADHKRSDFEKIMFEKKDSEFLPTKIDIFFDKKVFSLEGV